MLPTLILVMLKLISTSRFEHLGDSVLSMVVTELINEVYPHIRVGPSTVSTVLEGHITDQQIEACLRKSAPWLWATLHSLTCECLACPTQPGCLIEFDT